MADEQEIVVQGVVAVRQMPSYWHHTVPKISEDQPWELRRFFEELANLFGLVNITTEADKKAQTVCYVEVDMADMWKSLPEYSDLNSELYTPPRIPGGFLVLLEDSYHSWRIPTIPGGIPYSDVIYHSDPFFKLSLKITLV